MLLHLQQIKVMIANLKRAFKSLVNETSWMDSATKSIAIEKVDAMIDFVGYPQWIKNITELEDYYQGVLFFPVAETFLFNYQHKTNL